ncbi:MAG: hypothetical protein KDA87_03415 [Planctomycetales bacterium]|nr:hypothetical protein [Planctomycetales bacterium]
MNLRHLWPSICVSLSLFWNAIGQTPSQPADPVRTVDYIDTSFENASPVWYEFDSNRTIQVHLLYDHERYSPNRAAGHFHFRVHAKPGSVIRIEFNNLENVWNGKKASVAKELKAAAISHDGKTWKTIGMFTTDDGRAGLEVTLESDSVFVARIQPYRVSDLDKMLQRIRSDRRVAIQEIGRTVENRPLEIVRIGKPNAANHVFLRARAHPWEAGGNWVVEGLVERLLSDDAVSVEFLEQCCVSILPMANKDGVARGRTRFNSLGKDLNRNWDKPTDAALCPENAALEQWLKQEIAAGRKPDLAMELHNDGSGKLHISRPPVPNLEQHVQRMRLLESLLRRYTWFTEGSTEASFRNSGTLGDGWLERFGIDATVHEFNCHWIAGLQKHPEAEDWKNYGRQLPLVFRDYLRHRP